MSTTIDRAASISNDGVYRYSLSRTWDRQKRSMIFIMLNPSTADALVDDQTIRKCIMYAQREDCGSIYVVNCFAFRATDPAELKHNRAVKMSAVGPRNREFIHHALRNARDDGDIVVCGWGQTIRDCGRYIVAEAQVIGVPLYCFGKTATGEPRHPLYLSKQQKLEPYP